MSNISIKLKVPKEKITIKSNYGLNSNIILNTPDNLVNLTKRAEEAAKSAEENAEYVQEVINNFEGGNLVESVEEKDGNIEVTKANGEINIIELPMQFSVKILGDSEV